MTATLSRLIYRSVMHIRHLDTKFLKFPKQKFEHEMKIIEASLKMIKNKSTVKEYIHFLENEYLDCPEAWSDGSINIYGDISAFKRFDKAPSLSKYQNIIVSMLNTSFENMKWLYSHNKKRYIYSEAYHIHNVPAMLTENSRRIEYYLNVEVPAYCSSGNKKCISGFQTLWESLSAFNTTDSPKYCEIETDRISFSKIKNGSQSAEIFINDQNIKSIGTGDNIILYCTPKRTDSVTLPITQKYCFDTFEQLFRDYNRRYDNFKIFGFAPDKNFQECLDTVRFKYPAALELKHGIAALEFKNCSTNQQSAIVKIK